MGKKDEYVPPEDGKKRVGCKVNTTDGALVACARLGYAENEPGFYVAIGLHVFSQFLQFYLLAMFFLDTVEMLEDPYEDAQFTPVYTALRDAAAWKQPLNRTNLTSPEGVLRNLTSMEQGAIPMCTKNEVPTLLNIMLLIMLFGNAIADLSDIVWRAILIWSVDLDDDENDEPEEPAPGALSLDPVPALGENDIEHIKKEWKWIAFGVVIIPHFVCHVMIAWTGAKYLCLTQTFNKVIKAYLKVWFVSKIDAVLFKGFASDEFKKYTKNGQWVIDKPEFGYWSTALSTLAKVAVSVALAYFFLYVVFHNVMDMQIACTAYKAVFPDDFPSECLGDTCGMQWDRVFSS